MAILEFVGEIGVAWNSHKDADKVDEVIKGRYGANCRTLDYVVISHLHLDHLGYIQLVENNDGQLLNDQGGIWTEGENLQDPDFKGRLANYAGGILAAYRGVGEAVFSGENKIMREREGATGGGGPRNLLELLAWRPQTCVRCVGLCDPWGRQLEPVVSSLVPKGSQEYCSTLELGGWQGPLLD